MGKKKVDAVFVTLETVPYGGGYVANKNSIKKFEEYGLNVVVIGPYVNGKEEWPNFIPIKLYSSFNNPLEFKGRGERVVELCNKAESIIKDLKPERIISHSCHGVPLFQKFPDIKKIYCDASFHMFVLQSFEKHGIESPYNDASFLLELEEIGVKNADLIRVTTKNTYKKVLEYWGIDKSKLVVIPLGVDTNKFKQNGAMKEKKILYVGRMGAVKGFNILIEALRKVKKRENLKLTVVGENPFENHDLNDLVDNIEYKGSVCYDKMPEFYNKNTLQIIPSFFESFCLACTEGMASGIPIIATKTWGIKDQLESWDEQQVGQGDVDNLAHKILNSLNDSSKLESWSQRERERAVKEYDLDIITQKEIEIYFN